MCEFFAIMEEMDNYHYIDPNELLLCEAGLKENQDDKENKGILSTVGGFLKSLLEQCRKIIGSILGSIKNKIDYAFLSPEDKDKYNAYQNAVKNDPKLGQEKITVSDWVKVEYSYDTAFKRAETLSLKVEQKQISMEDAKKEEEAILASVTNLLGKGSSLITVEAALKMAAGSVESAKKIEGILQNNQALLQKIDQELGAGQAERLQKKVKKYTKETYAAKLKAQILGKKEKDISQVIHETVEEISKLNSFSGKVKFAVSHKGLILNAGKTYIKDKKVRKDVKRVMDARNKKMKERRIRRSERMQQEVEKRVEKELLRRNAQS